jgi:peptidoglycan/LPS O-acetylase OafA/YrhL
MPLIAAPHNTRHRLEFLDCIRAFCAFGVIYLHGAFFWGPVAGSIERSIFHFSSLVIDVGKIGVITFFMVSGFIIPVSLKVNKSRIEGIRNFLLGRIFRLYPAYWLSVAGAFILLFHASLVDFSVKKILVNLTMFQGFLGVENMLGIYWTLQIEWVFYIVCIVLYLLRSIEKPRRILGTFFFFLGVSFILALVRFKTHRAVPLAVPLSLAVMFASTLWRMATLDGRVEIMLYVRLAFGSFVISIPVISVLAYNFNAGFDETWYRYTLCYWITIGFFILATSRVKITWRPLAMAGQASYSLYLFNDFFQMILLKIPWLAPVYHLSPNLYLLLTMVIGSSVSILIYTYFEKPMIVLGKQLSRKLAQPYHRPAIVLEAGSTPSPQ